LFLKVIVIYFKKNPMENLFDQHTAQKFIDRIEKLTPQSKPLWGKMKVEQMLWHCQKPFEIVSGALTPKVNPVIKFLFGKSAKVGFTNTQPVKKNLPTFNEAKAPASPNFETEKNKLIDQIKNFQQRGPSGISKAPHPFFGPLTVDEWNTLEIKHLEHHLSQFGA
jgi:hypothetical protein